MGGAAEASIAHPAAPDRIVVRKLAILGAGAEGSWLAGQAVRAGYGVTLEDLMPARRRAAAQAIAEELRGQIAFADSVEEAVRDADLVIDFVPDELESKLEIFSLLDRMAPPHTIFATPTRKLSIADLASCTYRAERCVALDLALPPGAFAVSVVHAPGALQGVVNGVVGFWRSLGARVGVEVDGAALP